MTDLIAAEAKLPPAAFTSSTVVERLSLGGPDFFPLPLGEDTAADGGRNTHTRVGAAKRELDRRTAKTQHAYLVVCLCLVAVRAPFQYKIIFSFSPLFSGDPKTQIERKSVSEGFEEEQP